MNFIDIKWTSFYVQIIIQDDFKNTKSIDSEPKKLTIDFELILKMIRILLFLSSIVPINLFKIILSS